MSAYEQSDFPNGEFERRLVGLAKLRFCFDAHDAGLWGEEALVVATERTDAFVRRMNTKLELARIASAEPEGESS